VLQHPDVLPHARKGHVECLGQIRDRRVASSEPLQDTTPGGIGQRREGGIESAIGILNHLVQFIRLSGPECKSDLVPRTPMARDCLGRYGGRYWAIDMTAPDNAGPLLETKLYVPRLRRGQVGRPRLRERLSRGAESKLTLVSAPAGFGKTTLLADWLAAAPAGERSAAWLSLDHADNQPGSFWMYLITALQTVAPGVGAHALSIMREPQPPPIEIVLAPLLNELSTAPNDVVLVLDDYHTIDAHDAQDGMTFLLDHLPAQVHVIIATRADPALPLARLRARGELVEIRATDLRFTREEAAAYLNEVMALDLGASDIAALEARTEGWIAALQLAALSIQGRDDVAGFIAGFAGDDRYIVDYLVEEVLQRQPEHVRTFLLQTSILSRLSGPLSDAVTGHDGGKAMLEGLDRGNLFLVQLDDRRRWYRYHHLFADVLQARLLDEQADRVPDLHRRASVWYEQNSEPFEAIRHALAAEDFERAAELIERAMPALRSRRQEVAGLGWLKALPDELLASRPVLNVHYAGLLLDSGQLEGAEARLRDAERWLGKTAEGDERPNAPSANPIVVDEDEFRRLPSAIAVYRAAQAHLVGDVAGTMTHAERALDLVGDGDHLTRGSAAGLLALAHWTTGDLEAAHGSWADAMASLQRAGHLADAVGCAIALADIRIAQGRHRDALSTYERGLQLATEQEGYVVRGAADMHVGMAERFHDRDDLDTAIQHLRASSELGEHAGGRQNPYRWHVVMARIRETEGDPDGALELLDEAERLYVGDFYPRVRPIAALRARVWVAHGRLGDALGWARKQGLSAEDDLGYLREFEHITLARLLLAGSKRDRADHALRDAMGFLERLRLAAEQGDRVGSVIEILVLQALAHQMHGDVQAALVPLGRALLLAEPEGYARVFLDEGRSMAALLESAAQHGIASTYVRELLAASGKARDRAPAGQDLSESLSERELEVLRLLATDLNGPGIAAELVVSLNTVRSHTKSIYAKLGVNDRRAAVRRAEDLDILARTRRRR
jgi:ATP/maltotriose-dependent transcriptional regulator MalT